MGHRRFLFHGPLFPCSLPSPHFHGSGLQHRRSSGSYLWGLLLKRPCARCSTFSGFPPPMADSRREQQSPIYTEMAFAPDSHRISSSPHLPFSAAFSRGHDATIFLCTNLLGQKHTIFFMAYYTLACRKSPAFVGDFLDRLQPRTKSMVRGCFAVTTITKKNA